MHLIIENDKYYIRLIAQRILINNCEKPKCNNLNFFALNNDSLTLLSMQVLQEQINSI